MMTFFARLRQSVETVLAAFCVFLMTAMFVLVVVAVAYRELGESLTWYDEVATVLLAWLTYYGAALAALKRAHLGSPEVLRAMPMMFRLPLFVLSEVLVVGFFALLAWMGLRAMLLLAGDTLISLPWVSVQFTQSVIPIGATLFIVGELLSIPQEWHSLQHVPAAGEEMIERLS
jgi:TRAP-type C4-dicarboxylate transport system permease small subunit